MPRHRLLSLALALLVLATVLVAPPASRAATPPAPAFLQAPPPPPVAPAAISCDNVPFDRVLTIGADQEILVGFRGGFGTSQPQYLQTDVLDAAGPSLGRDLTWPRPGIDTPVVGGLWPVGTAADVDGDGTREMVMAYLDGSNNGRMAIVYANGTSSVQAMPVLNGSASESLAIGTLSSGENTSERVVVAARSATNSLQVVVVDARFPGTTSALWRTNQNGRASIQLLDLAVGDTDLDGSTDDIILGIKRQDGDAEAIVLTRDGSVGTVGSGSNIAIDMREIAQRLMGYGEPQSVKVAVGDLDGDYGDEVLFAQEDISSDSPGVSTGGDLVAFTLNYAADKKSATFATFLSGTLPDATGSLQIAAGDTDRDGLDEIVTAYRQFGDNSGLRVRVLEVAGGTTAGDPLRWSERGFFSNIADNRDNPQQLQLATGDMDKDGRADIVAAFRDSADRLQVMRLRDTAALGAPSQALVLQALALDNDGGRRGAFGITLALGDTDNDSLKAVYDNAPTLGVRCKEVFEPTISSAVFTPPFWSAIQSGGDRYATIGKARTESSSLGRGFTTSTTHSVFGYFGGEVDAEVAEFAARLTFGYETSTAITREGGESTSETISRGWSNSNSMAVVHNATFHCYNYQLRTGSTAVDGGMRFCRPVQSTEIAPALDTWDAQYGPTNNPDSRQWAPITRDWASLTIFRDGTALQSSTASNGEARRAADGTPDGDVARGSVSSTNQEAAPWWQVDLGLSQDITKVRVWNRGGTGCDAACRARLTDFYVFVSDVDPTTISNDPNVLKNDPRVRSYFNAGPAGAVANFLTLNNQNQPSRGRFVRVQLAGTGTLALAEVQVFGRNNVEPDRYPTNVRDNGTVVNGKYQPGTDGWFEVELFNPSTRAGQWVRVRGNLLWNGASKNVLGGQEIGPGEGMPSWLLTTERSKWDTAARSVSQALRVGAEFDAAVGVTSKVTFGGGYEATFGRAEQETRTLSWSDSFEVGGGVAGFPVGPTWPLQCSYSVEPIQYEVTEQATSGFAHRMMVVDYVVPNTVLQRTDNLVPCQPKTSGPPAFYSNTDRGAPGSVFTLVARNFPAGGLGTLQVQGPGESAFRDIVKLTLDEGGALVFALVTPANSQPGDYQVRLVVTPPGQAAAFKATQTAELKVTLDLAASPVTGAPDLPRFDLVAGRQLFVPRITR